MTDTMREAVLKTLTSYKQEMERYGYYSSNPGVSVDDFDYIADEIVAWQAAQMECKHSGSEQAVAVVGEPDCYDAGLLNDFGGGNVGWWQDYIRAELARAHEFYTSQWPTHSIPAPELERLRKDAERYQAVVIISQAALCHPSTRTDEVNRMITAYKEAVNAGLGLESAIDAAVAGEKK